MYALILAFVMAGVAAIFIPAINDRANLTRARGLDVVETLQTYPSVELGAKYGFRVLAHGNRANFVNFNSIAGVRGLMNNERKEARTYYEDDPISARRSESIYNGRVRRCPEDRQYYDEEYEDYYYCESEMFPFLDMEARLTTKFNGLDSRDVISLMSSGQDVFATTKNGVFRSRDQGRTFSKYEIRGIDSTYDHVTALEKDVNGVLWLGAYESGLRVADGGGGSAAGSGSAGAYTPELCEVNGYDVTGISYENADYDSDAYYAWAMGHSVISSNSIQKLEIQGNTLLGTAFNALFQIDLQRFRNDRCISLRYVEFPSQISGFVTTSQYNFVSTGVGVYRCDKSLTAARACMTKNTGLTSTIVNTIAYNSSLASGRGIMVVGTPMGLFYSYDNGERFNRMQMPAGDTNVTSILIDPELLFLVVGTREGAVLADLESSGNPYPMQWKRYSPDMLRGYHVTSIVKTPDSYLIGTDASRTQNLIRRGDNAIRNVASIRNRDLFERISTIKPQIDGRRGVANESVLRSACRNPVISSSGPVCGGVTVRGTSFSKPRPPEYRLARWDITDFVIEAPTGLNANGAEDLCTTANFHGKTWRRCLMANYTKFDRVPSSVATVQLPVQPLTKDLLFVIDDSGSMGEEIAIITQELSTFVEKLNSQGIFDFQLAVTTTDWHALKGDFLKSNKTLTPDAVGGISVVRSSVLNGTTKSIKRRKLAGGGFIPPYTSIPFTIGEEVRPGCPAEGCDINQAVLESEALFNAALERFVKGGSGDERGLASFDFAIGKAGDFLRPGVETAIIILSDEEDNSCRGGGAYCASYSVAGLSMDYEPVDHYVNRIQEMQANGRSVLFYPIVGRTGATPNSRECPEVASFGTRYMAVSSEVKSGFKNRNPQYSGSICNSKLADEFTAVAKELADRGMCYSLPELANADPAQITVTINGTVLPHNASYASNPQEGWMFDEQTRKVCFHARHVRMESELKFTYQRLL